MTIQPIPYIIYPHIYITPVPAQTGWLCPRCGAGVAPHATVCPCNKVEVTVTKSR